MKLREILKDIEFKLIKGNLDIEIEEISYDSRKVNDKAGFICLVGLNSDGHDYIDKAIENGAKVIFIQKDIDILNDVTVIKLKDTRRDLARMAINLFRRPSEEVTTIAITGTKGKTTTSFMIKNILEEDGKKVGVIGTMGVFYGDKHYATVNTTPESYDIHRYIREMVDNGVEYVIMEVSSQALKVGRVCGIVFDYGIFTNLTHDHIGEGEHANMEEYVYCKSLLFKQCKHGIFNANDKYFEDMVRDCTCDIHTFGYGKADLVIDKVVMYRDKNGLGIDTYLSGMIEGEFRINTPGIFSSYNGTAATMVSYLMGVKIESIRRALQRVAVRGRVEIVPTGSDFSVIIDYAHNGVAMENILKTMREYKPARIVTVFGCGGNRSKERRYDMGEISGRLSDLTIITEDNSRYEDVNDIMNDIEEGMKKTAGEYVKIPDRREAIRSSIKGAKTGDIILILGKGHETYQEKDGKRVHFDDREEALKVIEEINKERNG